MAKNFDPKDPRTWGPAPRPTEAFTQPGQAAKGLAKARADRFASTAKTPVYDLTGYQNNMPWNKGALAGIQSPMASLTPVSDMRPIDYAYMTAGLAAMFGGPKKTADVWNDSYLTGKTVVHGSPVSGLTEITPNKAAYRPQEALSYGWNPSSFGNNAGLIYNNVSEYTQPKSGSGYRYFDSENLGSVYVGRVPRSSIVNDPKTGMVASDMPIKRLEEIKLKMGEPDQWGNRYVAPYTEALQSALRRKGVFQSPDIAGKLNRLKLRLRPEIYNGPV